MSYIGNNNYRVTWQHNIEPKFIVITHNGVDYRVKNKVKSSTTCILLGERSKPIFQATVVLNPKDGNYVKEVGRTESLLRVLNNLENIILKQKNLIQNFYYTI